MDLQVESRGDRKIVRLKEKVTFESCTELQSRLDHLFDSPVREIVLDLKDVPFIDSSGIGEILRLLKLTREQKGDLVLINPNRKLKDLFKMYRFESFMKIRDAVAPGEE